MDYRELNAQQMAAVLRSLSHPEPPPGLYGWLGALDEAILAWTARNPQIAMPQRVLNEARLNLQRQRSPQAWRAVQKVLADLARLFEQLGNAQPPR